MSASTQGKNYRQKWQTFHQQTRPTYIEDTHEGNPPIFEGFQSNTTSKANATTSGTSGTSGTSSTPESTTPHENLQPLFDRFDDAMSQYNTTMQQVSQMEDQQNKVLARNNNVPRGLSPFLGMVVQTSQGEHYYITRYGHLRKYSTSAWLVKDSVTCGSGASGASGDDSNNTDGKIPTVSQSILELCLPGPDMNSHEPCGKEGKVVREGTTQNYKWVDVQGYGHPFDTAVAYQNNQSCPSDYETLPSDAYSAIASGPSMDSGDVCSLLVRNPELDDELKRKKLQLMADTQELLSIVEEIESKDETATNQYKEQRRALLLAVSNLKKEATHNEQAKAQQDTLKGRWQDLLVEERMEYYQYAGMVAIGAVVTGALFHHMFSRSS